jgi:hypothetical protein
MTTYYVATLGHYVLVEAADEVEARTLARPLLEALQAPAASRLGRDLPVVILTVRPATDGEVELVRFHRRMQNPHG